MRPDEPQPLVHPARNLGEDIDGVCVVELVELTDRMTRNLAECSERRGESLDIFAAVTALRPVFRERGTRGDGSSGALGATAELDRSLRDEVDVFLDVVIDLVEKWCREMKSGPFTFQ